MSMTQAPPLVSIIIPAFNAAPVLVEALESARVQTFQNFEAIIVDDGSTDDTAEIARRFCAGDSRFRLLRQANAGLPAARNTALGQANGKWIAFLDADDAWLAQKLEHQLALAGEDARANFLFTNFYFWDGARDLAIRYRANRPLPDGDTSTKLIFSICMASPPSSCGVKRFRLSENLINNYSVDVKIGIYGCASRNAACGRAAFVNR